MIRVYDVTERQFNHNGIKVLRPLFAEITKVDNGDYYIEVEDLLDNLEYYQKGMIIRADSPWGVQGFRCDNPVAQNNRISCKAWHLSYDAENYIINSATATDKSCNDAINYFNNTTDKISPFTVKSDISELKTITIEKTTLFGAFVELTNQYGGKWYRDNFTFGIMSSVGEDRGVVLAYSKNITDIKVEENWDSVCTKLLPYAKDGDKVITLEDTYVELRENPYDIPYTKVAEFKYEAKEGTNTPAEGWTIWLKEQAERYLEENKLPKVNYSVSAKLDNVSDVGDMIYIKHPKCRVDIEAQVISVKYDAITGRYTNIEFGNFKKEIKNLVNEVASIVGAEVEKKIAPNNSQTDNQLVNEINKINDILSGGYVINYGGQILVVDALPKEDAVNCFKIDNEGVCFSNTGIYGTFNPILTIDNSGAIFYATSGEGLQVRIVEGKLQVRYHANGVWSGWRSLQGDVLFDGETNTTVNLSESVENFSYIEVYYSLKASEVNYFQSVKVHSPQGKICSLFASSDVNIGMGTISLNGATISFSTNNTFLISNYNEPVGTNGIYINKVVGYR